LFLEVGSQAAHRIEVKWALPAACNNKQMQWKTGIALLRQLLRHVPKARPA
jgi:hypothetical protein